MSTKTRTAPKTDTAPKTEAPIDTATETDTAKTLTWDEMTEEQRAEALANEKAANEAYLAEMQIELSRHGYPITIEALADFEALDNNAKRMKYVQFQTRIMIGDFLASGLTSQIFVETAKEPAKKIKKDALSGEGIAAVKTSDMIRTIAKSAMEKVRNVYANLAALADMPENQNGCQLDDTYREALQGDNRTAAFWNSLTGVRISTTSDLRKALQCAASNAKKAKDAVEAKK
jgi:hypothetical protein